MKLIRKLIISIVVIVGIGYGVYHFGTKLLADKVVDQVGAQLEDSGEVEAIKQLIESDSKLKEFVEEGTNISEDTLPFSTKEEAVQTLVRKFDLDDIKEMGTTIQDGLTLEEQQELVTKMETILSQEEIDALKVIVYKELQNTE